MTFKFRTLTSFCNATYLGTQVQHYYLCTIMSVIWLLVLEIIFSKNRIMFVQSKNVLRGRYMCLRVNVTGNSCCAGSRGCCWIYKSSKLAVVYTKIIHHLALFCYYFAVLNWLGTSESQDTLSEVLAGITSPVDTGFFCKTADSSTMYTVTSMVRWQQIVLFS